MDSETIYRNFVLRVCGFFPPVTNYLTLVNPVLCMMIWTLQVMAARSPNVKLGKALSKQLPRYVSCFNFNSVFFFETGF